MKVLCFSSREWGRNIFRNISNAVEFADDDIIITTTKKDGVSEMVYSIIPDVILFCGWSWMIPPIVTAEFLCIGLHPSPLPKYRGGSPIQNQIIRGEKISAVSLFKITEKLDEGDVLFQESISLDGFIDDIFKRIVRVGTTGILSILRKIKNGHHPIRLALVPGNGSFYKRLKNNSEITIDDLQRMSSTALYDKIRMLSGFFPNAYFTCKDGTKLYIEKVRLGEKDE